MEEADGKTLDVSTFFLSTAGLSSDNSTDASVGKKSRHLIHNE